MVGRLNAWLDDRLSSEMNQVEETDASRLRRKYMLFNCSQAVLSQRRDA